MRGSRWATGQHVCSRSAVARDSESCSKKNQHTVNVHYLLKKNDCEHVFSWREHGFNLSEPSQSLMWQYKNVFPLSFLICPAFSLEGAVVRATLVCLRYSSWAAHSQCLRPCPSPVLLSTHLLMLNIFTDWYSKMGTNHNPLFQWQNTYIVTSWGFFCLSIVWSENVIAIMPGSSPLCRRIHLSFPSPLPLIITILHTITSVWIAFKISISGATVVKDKRCDRTEEIHCQGLKIENLFMSTSATMETAQNTAVLYSADCISFIRNLLDLVIFSNSIQFYFKGLWLFKCCNV